MKGSSGPIKGLHLVRYGIAGDQKFLLDKFLPTYDQLVINANMVAHMPSALASFLTQRARNKPYFIDPQTHAFQHDISYLESASEKKQGEIKRSIKALLEEYGEPVRTCVGGEKHNPVLPSHFQKRKAREEFCERVLRFQLEAIAKEVQASDSAKYYDYLKRKGLGVTGNFRPSLVVAPYFYLAANVLEQWLPINIKCALDSKEQALDLNVPLGVQVVLSRSVLMNSTLLEKLVQEYGKVRPSVFLVWVDAFSEQQASADELTVFVNLLKKLGDAGQVVNLYGGFFSVALNLRGVVRELVGVTHGLEYGEDRPVVPVGGGFPVPKYYFPALHTRLPFRDALRAVRAVGGMKSVRDFHRKVCDCNECREVITSDPEVDFARYGETQEVEIKRGNQRSVREYPLPETKKHSVSHYMWCKKREYKLDHDLILDELKWATEALGKALGLGGTAHCGAWSRVLSSYSREV